MTSKSVSPTGKRRSSGGFVPKAEAPTVGLKQKISLFNGCAIIIGVIVGSGIFVSPKGVLIHTGSPLYSLLIWLACGLFSLCGALCYAELGTTIPKSGGDYAYIYEAFGRVPAFLFLWIALIIVNPTSIAVMALTFSTYVLQPFYGDEVPPDFVVRVIASSIIIIFTVVNCFSVRWSTRTQDVSTITKVGALIVIVCAGLAYLALGNVENLKMVERNTVDLSLPQIALAFYQGVFSYSGCCIGGVNGIIFTSSRMFFAGARDGQLPELLAMISLKHSTPVPSLILLAFLSVLMLNFADVLVLINYLSFSESSVVAMSILALVKMRICDPDLPRPIKFHIAFPLVFLALCVYILVAPFVRQPYELFAALVIILSGLPVYLLFVATERRPTVLYGMWIRFTHCIQKIFLCVTEDTH
ncbi:hypothetical protein M3Y99_00792800 [Aphelenchoides fujianensis]|nr:hypothetical protein M3Y99_00792800 [Aphelenchoides fujianensis]